MERGRVKQIAVNICMVFWIIIGILFAFMPEMPENNGEKEEKITLEGHDYWVTKDSNDKITSLTHSESCEGQHN